MAKPQRLAHDNLFQLDHRCANSVVALHITYVKEQFRKETLVMLSDGSCCAKKRLRCPSVLELSGATSCNAVDRYALNSSRKERARTLVVLGPAETFAHSI